MAGAVPRSLASETGGSTERSLYPAADARSAATTARCGSAVKALHSAPACQVTEAAPVNVGQGGPSARVGPTQEREAQAPVRGNHWQQLVEIIHVLPQEIDTVQLGG